jgi:hypothetical protein
MFIPIRLSQQPDSISLADSAFIVILRRRQQ